MTAYLLYNGPENILERIAIEGDSPVYERVFLGSRIQSRSGHVKSGLKQGRPLSNPKYSYHTDSEQVP